MTPQDAERIHTGYYNVKVDREDGDYDEEE
jgi:hypothetical protein